MNFKKVVIAVDFHPDSLETLSQIKDLEIPESAEVHLIHAFEFVPSVFDFSFVYPPTSDDRAKIKQIMEEKLVGFKNQIGLNPKTKVVFNCFVTMNARQELLSYVDKVGANVVIAASREKPGILGFFEGSFTAFLNKFCRANLIVLRPKPVYSVG